MSNYDVYSDLDKISENLFKNFMTKTFGIMAAGLVISGVVAYFSFMDVVNGGFLYDLMLSDFGYLLLIFGQLGIAIVLGWMLYKMSTTIAYVLFFAYCVITGVTFGILPLVYGVSNMFYAFGFAAVLFISMAVIGYTTKVDISKFSGLLIAGLFTLVIISIASLFINLSGIELIVCYAGVIIFLGLTAWDTQKLKAMYHSTADDSELLTKMSIYGAFQLYLDFINLFLYILRILGRRGKK